jgi:hypothetical protein
VLPFQPLSEEHPRLQTVFGMHARHNLKSRHVNAFLSRLTLAVLTQLKSTKDVSTVFLWPHRADHLTLTTSTQDLALKPNEASAQALGLSQPAGQHCASGDLRPNRADPKLDNKQLFTCNAMRNSSCLSFQESSTSGVWSRLQRALYITANAHGQ